MKILFSKKKIPLELDADANEDLENQRRSLARKTAGWCSLAFTVSCVLNYFINTPTEGGAAATAFSLPWLFSNAKRLELDGLLGNISMGVLVGGIVAYQQVKSEIAKSKKPKRKGNQIL